MTTSVREPGGLCQRQRYNRLLEFLREREDLLSRCEVVYSIEEGTNLFFLGEEVLFEGHKTRIEGGYGWTMVYTDQNYLETRLKIFDMLFQSARRHTLKRYGDANAAEGDPKALRDAVIKAVLKARDGDIDRWRGV